MVVIRIYHSGRDRGHRARDRALVAAGVEVVLVVPQQWDEHTNAPLGQDEPFEIIELPVNRPGDVNRHTYVDVTAITKIVCERRPELVDIHEEPLSAVMHQVHSALASDVRTVGYAAQNLDKRYPPPFTGWERQAFGRLSGIYPCSRQAASVLRGRGYRGELEVLPLGVDPTIFHSGDQQHDAAELTLALIGRMVPEKGVRDAVQALSAVRRNRPARLVLAGSGPELAHVESYAAEFGVSGSVETRPWASQLEVANLCRASHVVLVPSRSTARWVEQFGRTVVEAQAAGAAVVGYASGTISEVARGAAWLAAEGDATGLARATAQLATDADAWTELRNAGLDRARTSSWTAVATRQLSLYERALTRGPAQPVVASATSRAAAAEEYGPPALTGDGQRRPYALPVLRSAPRLARLAGSVADQARVRRT